MSRGRIETEIVTKYDDKGVKEFEKSLDKVGKTQNELEFQSKSLLTKLSEISNAFTKGAIDSNSYLESLKELNIAIEPLVSKYNKLYNSISKLMLSIPQLTYEQKALTEETIKNLANFDNLEKYSYSLKSVLSELAIVLNSNKDTQLKLNETIQVSQKEIDNYRNQIKKLEDNLRKNNEANSDLKIQIKNIKQKIKELNEEIKKHTKQISDNEKKIKDYEKSYESLNNTLKNTKEATKEASKSLSGSTKFFSDFGREAKSRFLGVFKDGLAIGLASTVVDSLKAMGEAVINFTQDSLKASSQMIELKNVTEQVFEQSANEVGRWAETTASAMGRSTYSMNEFVSNIGAVYKGLGVGGETLEKVSKDLSTFAVDLASFRDISDDRAYTAIMAGIVGETEPLKRLGVIINDLAMSEYIHSKGIKEKWKNLTQAEKAMYRYNKIMESTNFIQGDAVRTLGTYANQTKVYRANIENLKLSIGNSLKDVSTSGLTAINNVLTSLNKTLNPNNAISYFSKFKEESATASRLITEYVRLSKKELNGLASEVEKDRRIQIYNQLAEAYPTIIGNISKEKENYQEVAKALDDINAKLKEKVIMQMSEDYLKEYASKMQKVTSVAVERMDKIETLINDSRNNGLKITDTLLQFADKIVLEMNEDFTDFSQSTLNEIANFLEKQGIKGNERSYAEFISNFKRVNKDFEIAVDKAQRKSQKEAERYEKQVKTLQTLLGKSGQGNNELEYFNKLFNSIDGLKLQTKNGVESIKSNVRNANQNILKTNANIGNRIDDSESVVISKVKTAKNSVENQNYHNITTLSEQEAMNSAKTHEGLRILSGNIITTIKKVGNAYQVVIDKMSSSTVPNSLENKGYWSKKNTAIMDITGQGETQGYREEISSKIFLKFSEAMNFANGGYNVNFKNNLLKSGDGSEEKKKDKKDKKDKEEKHEVPKSEWDNLLENLITENKLSKGIVEKGNTLERLLPKINEQLREKKERLEFSARELTKKDSTEYYQKLIDINNDFINEQIKLLNGLAKNSKERTKILNTIKDKKEENSNLEWEKEKKVRAENNLQKEKEKLKNDFETNLSDINNVKTVFSDFVSFMTKDSMKELEEKLKKEQEQLKEEIDSIFENSQIEKWKDLGSFLKDNNLSSETPLDELAKVLQETEMITKEKANELLNFYKNFKKLQEQLKFKEEYQKILTEAKKVINEIVQMLKSLSNVFVNNDDKSLVNELINIVATTAELATDIARIIVSEGTDVQAIMDAAKNATSLITTFVSKIVEIFNSKAEIESDKEFANKKKEIDSNTTAIRELTHKLKELSDNLVKSISVNTSNENLKYGIEANKLLIQTYANTFNPKLVATGVNEQKALYFIPWGKEKFSTSKDFSELLEIRGKTSKELRKIYEEKIKNLTNKDLEKFQDKENTFFNKYELTIRNSNLEQIKQEFLAKIKKVEQLEEEQKHFSEKVVFESFQGVSLIEKEKQKKEMVDKLKELFKDDVKLAEMIPEFEKQVEELLKNQKYLISVFDEVRNKIIENVALGRQGLEVLGDSLLNYFNKLRSNLSKVFYDLNYRTIEEKFENKFLELNKSLVDIRLNGKSLKELNISSAFTDLFKDIKKFENLKNDVREIVETLRKQAKEQGISDSIIDKMLPLEELEDKFKEVTSALNKAMKLALDTNSFNQFTMSLGDSLYNSVKESLIKAFSESETYKGLLEKYVNTDEYKAKLSKASDFKSAYAILKEQLDSAEDMLKANGLAFRETNGSTGEYLNGLVSRANSTNSSVLANQGISFNMTMNIDNHGFIAVEDLKEKFVNLIVEELTKKKQKEV